MGPCCAGSSPAGPIGAAACAALCAAACAPTAPACFSDDAIAWQVDSEGVAQKVAVQELVPGDHVLTLSHGRFVATKVLHNQRSRGDFAFTELVAKQGETVFNLTVTDEHNLVWARGGQESKMHLGEDDWEVAMARLLNVGDFVPVMVTNETAGAGARTDLARLTWLRQVQLNVKNTLITELGTMLANGILVTTICDGDLLVDPPKFNATLQKWRSLHRGLATCAAVPMKQL